MANELLTPNFWSIEKLFNYRFSVPVYQRPYSWTNEEVDSLLLDIWAAYSDYQKLNQDEKQKSSLYVGNIILHTKAFEVFDIIDGQQRITTFSLFLLALYARVFELGVDANDRILVKIQKALWKFDIAERPSQDKRVIELGSIDKQIAINIFNEAFSAPEKLKKYAESYEVKTPFEGHVKSSFLRAYSFVLDKYSGDENELQEVLFFANYMLTKVHLIAIINEDSEFKAFSIFESINSKGKKLEEIDLIKTRIFSTLSESDYASYLTKWGDLIVKTGDKLYDFLKTYIRANIKYYTGNVTFNNFKNMDKELCAHFQKTNVSDAYKALIEDMLATVDNFNALFSVSLADRIVSNNRLRFYYAVFVKIKYEHPRALFYRSFCEYKSGKLSKDDLIAIIIETIKFCISFLTISGKDSKDTIQMFSAIFERVYGEGRVNKESVIYQINLKMGEAGITHDSVSSSLKAADLFEKNKALGVAVASVFESRYMDAHGDQQVSWDEAYSKFSTYGSLALDHIMVQTPPIDDPNLKYYKLGNNLKLKEGHDFPTELVYDGMEYETFKSRILHRAGNLKLKGGDGNSSKGNTSDVDFCTYAKLEERNNIVCTFFEQLVTRIEGASANYNPSPKIKAKGKRLTGNFDFSMKGVDLTGTKPRSITILDKTVQISKLKDILTSVVLYIFETNQDRLLQMATDWWAPRKRVIIKNTPDGLVSAYALVEGAIYVETNLSARDIVSLSGLLLDIFNIERDKVSVYIPE